MAEQDTVPEPISKDQDKKDRHQDQYQMIEQME